MRRGQKPSDEIMCVPWCSLACSGVSSTLQADGKLLETDPLVRHHPAPAMLSIRPKTDAVSDLSLEMSAPVPKPALWAQDSRPDVT
jgi:hypothetical protein